MMKRPDLGTFSGTVRAVLYGAEHSDNLPIHLTEMHLTRSR